MFVAVVKVALNVVEHKRIVIDCDFALQLHVFELLCCHAEIKLQLASNIELNRLLRSRLLTSKLTGFQVLT